VTGNKGKLFTDKNFELTLLQAMTCGEGIILSMSDPLIHPTIKLDPLLQWFVVGSSQII
jgi:hypothetical protein